MTRLSTRGAGWVPGRSVKAPTQKNQTAITRVQKSQTKNQIATANIAGGGGGGSLVALRNIAGVFMEGSTNSQATTFANMKTQASGSVWVNGPFNFTVFMNECDFGRTSDQNGIDATVSAIGNMADGCFRENGVIVPSLRAYQFWPTTPNKIVVSCVLSYGPFGMTAAQAASNMNNVINGALDGAPSDGGGGFAKLGWAIAQSGLDMSKIWVRLGWESSGQIATNTPNYPWSYVGGNQSLYATLFNHAATVMQASGYTGHFEWNVQGNPGGGFDSSAYPSKADTVGADIYNVNGAPDTTTMDAAQSFAKANHLQFGLSECGYTAARGDDLTYMQTFLTKLKTYPAPGLDGGLAYYVYFDSTNGASSSLNTIPNTALYLAQQIA